MVSAMPDPVLLTCKMPPDLADAMLRESAAMDVSKSEYLRQCLRLAMPLLRAAPDLMDADDKRIADLMPKVGNILVILDKV